MTCQEPACELDAMDAIQDLREAYRENRADFAIRVGVHPTTIAIYEHERPPRSSKRINALILLAVTKKRWDIAETLDSWQRDYVHLEKTQS